MKLNLVLYTLCCLLLLTMATSCSTASKYGNRSDKYSRARSKSNNSRPYDVKTKEYSETKNRSNGKVKPILTQSPYKPTLENVKRDQMVASAQQYIGIPYKSAGKSPLEGFDCSGFANFVYNQNGFSLSGPSYDLAKMGAHRDQADLKPGDLVFFGLENKINHVGIVTQNTENETHFIHSSSSEGIKIDQINGSEYWSKRYLFGRDLLLDLMMGKYMASKP
jgi:cell wall-associated NlpC family hydrolase